MPLSISLTGIAANSTNSPPLHFDTHSHLSREARHWRTCSAAPHRMPDWGRVTEQFQNELGSKWSLGVIHILPPQCGRLSYLEPVGSTMPYRARIVHPVPTCRCTRTNHEARFLAPTCIVGFPSELHLAFRAPLSRCRGGAVDLLEWLSRSRIWSPRPA